MDFGWFGGLQRLRQYNVELSDITGSNLLHCAWVYIFNRMMSGMGNGWSASSWSERVVFIIKKQDIKLNGDRTFFYAWHGMHVPHCVHSYSKTNMKWNEMTGNEMKFIHIPQNDVALHNITSNNNKSKCGGFYRDLEIVICYKTLIGTNEIEQFYYTFKM